MRFAVLVLAFSALPAPSQDRPPSEQEPPAPFSPNNVIGKLFPLLSAEVSNKIDAPHLGLAAWQSDRNANPGTRVTLGVEVRLPAGVHVYSPGVQGYKPIEMAITPSPEIELAALNYPRAKILYLPAIKERVPVFEGAFRITQDVLVSSAPEFSKALGEAGRTLVIKGQLKYQACDAKICYVPVTVPLEWQLAVAPLGMQRAPAEIRHK